MLVGASVVGTFKPTSTNYLMFFTSTFTVAAGAHTIEFLGLDTAGRDNTDFLDAVSVVSSIALTVNAKPLTVTAAAKSMTYGGTVPALTYTYTGQVNGDTPSFTGGLATTATSSSSVGSYAITQGTLAATGNYTIGTFNPDTLTVNRATPTINWSNPAPITYLTPLTGTQLNATASWTVGGSAVTVGGTFAYAPPAGTVLSAGTQTLSTSFTPSDSTDYTTATATVQIVVLGPGTYVYGTTLYVVGASTSDNAQISSAGSKSDGSTGLQVNATLNGVYTSKTFTQTLTAIVIAGGAGNDNLQLASGLTLPTTVTEGNGNNYIKLGGGNDTVTLGTGSNQVFGGNGNKTITASDAAGTTGYISLGNGNDTISLGAGNDQVVLGTGNNVVTAGNGTDAVTTSGSGNNSITLGNGNDSVTTGNGNDTIALGSGTENVQTGNGNKTISAGNGNNYVHAGTGTDVVTMGNGVDNVQLGDGNDTVTLGDGNDYVSAGAGNDTVTLGDGADNVQLGNGSDVVIEGNGNDYVSAGTGADLVVGGLGQHTIQLGNGNDILIDGSATVVNPGDSFRQILSDWNTSSSASVNTRLNVIYNTVHPNYLSAGSGRDWFFYHAPTTSNKKSTDRLN